MIDRLGFYKSLVFFLVAISDIFHPVLQKFNAYIGIVLNLCFEAPVTVNHLNIPPLTINPTIPPTIFQIKFSFASDIINFTRW